MGLVFPGPQAAEALMERLQARCVLCTTTAPWQRFHVSPQGLDFARVWLFYADMLEPQLQLLVMALC